MKTSLPKASFLAALMTLTPMAAQAQTVAVSKANVDTRQFRPSATSNGILSSDSAFVAPHLSVAGGLWLDYAHDPVVVVNGAGTQTGKVISDAYEMHLQLSLALWNRLEVGVLLPIQLRQTVNDANFPTASGLAHSALGDLQLDVKGVLVRARGEKVAFNLALALGLGLPTGSTTALYGEGGVTFMPRLVAGLRAVDRVELSLQIGALIRGERQLSYGVTFAQQLSFGGALSVRLVDGLHLSGNITGFTPFNGSKGVEGTPVEALGGPEYRFQKLPFELIAAAGRGVTSGIGSADFRVVFGFRYQPRELRDSDQDGTPDRDDKCPTVAGPKANRGCPVAPLLAPVVDRDRDGLIDTDDKCPTVAGPADNHGCPDRDADGDSIVDRLDQCPAVAGPVENRGCPWPDSDQDGIVDQDDKCPQQAGPVANQGCPDVDTDGDGIVDRLDKCPNEKETFNGVEDDDGCPEAKAQTLAILTANGIEISQQVFFETGKAVIKPVSFKLLAAVAAVMNVHPELKKLRVEGHTDSSGSHDKNVALSQARAEAVRTHLVDVNGIAAARLEARGFGPDRPIADNRTATGRARNRRCQFVMVKDGE